MLRKVGCLLGLALAVPVAALVVVGLVAPLSPSGWLYLAAATVLVGGLISAPFREDRLKGVTRGACVLVLLVGLARFAIAGEGRTISMVVLPGGQSSRVVDRLIDEQDLALPGARLLVALGAFPEGDGAGWPEVMAGRYAAMRTAEGWVPSAIASTYLGLQSPDAFSTLVVEPRSAERARVGVVFLHGYAGSSTVLCWELAVAAQAVDAVTACPAIGWRGRWWEGDEGELTVRRTVAYLRRRGISRVYLAGLSNGGAGASMLATRVGALGGVMLLSGELPGAPELRVPVLVVHGRSDRMMPIAAARAYAERAGRRATLVELEGGHFVFEERHEEVRAAIGDWLTRLERRAARGLRPDDDRADDDDARRPVSARRRGHNRPRRTAPR